jgi:hypothetical protein
MTDMGQRGKKREKREEKRGEGIVCDIVMILLLINMLPPCIALLLFKRTVSPD